jgi:phosphate transport system protein
VVVTRASVAVRAPAMTVTLGNVSEVRKEFSRTLGTIEAKVTGLFGMVTEDLPAATHALLRDPGDAAVTLAEREQAIDALYLEIEELAGREVLLQAPVASDLRFLLSVLRIVPELERSHDLVMQIASRAGPPLDGALSPGVRALAERAGALATVMWRQAAGAWRTRDGSVASALAERDEEMDQLHASLMAELASGSMTLPMTMEMTLVARCYERLGAHAVNVTRRVAYLAGPAAG